MADVTVNYNLPFPEADDPADVPADIEALAVASDDGLKAVDDARKALGVQTGQDFLVAVPIGCIMMWAAVASPTGWLFCLGQTIPAATYPKLALVFPTSGGNITLPDLRGRVPLGSGTASPAVPGGTAHALAQKGGEEKHALTAAETASKAHSHGGATDIEQTSLAHSHGASSGGAGGHNHNTDTPGWPFVMADRAGVTGWSSAFSLSGQNVPSLPPPGGNWKTGFGTAAVADHAHSVAVNSGGPLAHKHNYTTTNNPSNADGAAANNLPPYLAVNFIIRAA